MVAKISIGASLYGVLAYNQEKVDQGMGSVIGTNQVLEPSDGKFNIHNCMEDFERWMPSHFRTQKPVIHISLNPHPDEKLTNEQLSDIGREYMDKLGYGGQPYIIFKHEDIDREHIHVVSLRVGSDGKKIGDSFEHKRSKEITEDLEKKYGLHPAEGQKQGEQWKLALVDSSRGDLKKQISSVIKPLCSMYKFQSMGEYKALLSLYNIGIEEVKGEMRGNPYRGLLYCTLDTEGNKSGTPLKSSLFGKTFGFDGLEKQMEKSGEQIKQPGFKDKTRNLVSIALDGSRNESEFRAKLQEGNIDLVLRRNNEGRIYGATFIDHNERSVLNGSRLGKEFSANVLNEKFSGQQPEPMHDNVRSKAIDDISKQTIRNNTDDSAVGEMLSLFTPETGNADDNGPLPQQHKKKKRRYGRQM